MSYIEAIGKALKGKSVNATAKAWGVSQSTMDLYVKGRRLPTFNLALRIADEAGISHGEMLEKLAEQEVKLRQEKEEKIEYNADRPAVVAQLVEQLIRNQ